jgi:lycopene cyclase domain-containing protein
MTYLGFLALFVLPPIVMLAFWLRPGRRIWFQIGILLVVVYLWTTPWDNYLVASGVWFYNPRQVLGVILGYVPLEEYLFFGLETILGGLWVAGITAHFLKNNRTARIYSLLAGIAVLAALAALATLRYQSPTNMAASRPWTYLALILVWSLPVILLQLALGWRELSSRWQVWLLGALVPALYLTAIDAIALSDGVWTIDPQQSYPLFFAGIVPLEEGVFFLATNLMIAQGLILANHPRMHARLNAWLDRLRSFPLGPRKTS